MNNQECKIRAKIIDVNNNEPVFYPFSIKVNKCSGSCNNINNPYAKLCVPDVVKNINVKVSNLMSWSDMKTSKCIHVFVKINKDGMEINVDVNGEKN